MWEALIRDPNRAVLTSAPMQRYPKSVHISLVKKSKPPRPAAPVVKTWEGNPWHLSGMQLRTVAALATMPGPRSSVAAALGITEKTMETHLCRARERMKAPSTQAAMSMWVRVSIALALEKQRAAAEAKLIAKLPQP